MVEKACFNLHSVRRHILCVGNKGEIHIPQSLGKAFPHKNLPLPLKGTVESIGEMIFSNSVTGEDPTAPRGLRVVQVRVLLEENELAGRMTNLEGQLRIHLGTGESP